MKWCNEKETRIHFVGIGGIGMSGIAEVLHNQGYIVSGSDLGESAITLKLSKIGIQIFKGHQASNVGGAHTVVISSAVKADNPEVLEAKKRSIPVIPRAEMLAEIMRGKTGIALAGTHGKTTTTSMMAAVLTSAGLDPTSIVGGIVASLGSNAKLGQGDIVLAEADESDGSFLRLPATFAVITNIDNDHLDFYQSIEALDDAFTQFVSLLPFYGQVAICGDDVGVQRILPHLSKPYVTYGFGLDCKIRAQKIDVHGENSFKVFNDNRLLGEVTIQVPGEHNILNALGVLSICLRIGLSFDQIKKGLAEYHGVQRRFEIKWKDKNRVVVDDYGHHPTEIVATLKAARDYWKGRIITVFQPHRYSRTQSCYEQFVQAFKDSDITYLVDIYAAGEVAITGIDSKTLSQDIQGHQKGTVEYLQTDIETMSTLKASFKEGDLLLFLGAGSITKMASQFVAEII